MGMGLVLEFCPRILDVPDYARRHGRPRRFLVRLCATSSERRQRIRLHQAGAGIADEIKVTDVVSKPGEYDISVTYHSSISRSFINEFLKHDPISTLPVWTMEQPAIKAGIQAL